MLSSLVFCVILSIAFLVVNTLVGKKAMWDREKGSPYECGFETIRMTRVSFSLRFFLVAVIFLVFDLEMVLIFPWVLKRFRGFDWLFVVSMVVFILILSLGLAWE
ncbi:MAG: NADH dehydrogenase subunit 3 [Candidatus Sedimenticola sp. 20ELBAFRAG]